MNWSTVFSVRNVVRGIVLGFLPWGPAFLFERLDFYFGYTRNGTWYYNLSGNRMFADIASFALTGILLAYWLRPRWAILQLSLSTVTLWVLFYQACQTFRLYGRWFSECYQTGPDGLAGYRLVLLLFCLGALPVMMKAAGNSDRFNPRLRPFVALFGSIVISIVMQWYALSSWFSGVPYIAPFEIIQALVLFGIPQIAAGILAARLSKSLIVASLSGAVSLIFVSASFWTLLCPGCDRSVTYYLAIPWILFASLGALTELGLPKQLQSLGSPKFFVRWNARDYQRVMVGLAVAVSVMSLLLAQYWDSSVLYATSISPAQDNRTLGLPAYPYVGGYDAMPKLRICCVEIGVSFVNVNTKLLAPDNFLMAGIGVQSPNCCVDGWDMGWRADVFVLPNRTLIVSGTTWSTCDTNPNCGGHFWEDARYHAQVNLHPSNISQPIYLRMMWEAGRANWYYNTTGVAWQKFGSFKPDFREGNYFDIGIDEGIGVNLPQTVAYFHQFGVASKTFVRGWTVQLLYPKYMDQGVWHYIEKAGTIQGDYSYWKGNYRWGGIPYYGVSAGTNSTDPSLPPYVVEFSYTGRTLRNNSALW